MCWKSDTNKIAQLSYKKTPGQAFFYIFMIYLIKKQLCYNVNRYHDNIWQTIDIKDKNEVKKLSDLNPKRKAYMP